MNITPEVIERFKGFLARVGDCLIFTGAKHEHGYGCFNIDGVIYKAHRVSWEINKGAITGGLKVLHKCDNPPCVEINHLFLGTQKNNIDDMNAKKRNPMTIRRDSCQRGHLFTPENTRIMNRGRSRGCRTCIRMKIREWKSNHK